MRPNTVLRQLRAGEPSIGTWLSLGSPLAAEQLLEQAGFDWLNIDQEHGSIDATLSGYILQAISIGSTIPLVRVPWNSGDWIKRALDAGAYGVVIPMVNSRAEAEQAVRACRYPPQGYRSVGGIRTRLYGGSDYLEQANDEIACIVQIEHIEAVKRAREILSVPGIDAYFVGPNDLCASMGLPPSLDPPHEEFWTALDGVHQIARELGVPSGIHVASAEGARRAIDLGYQFISVASDAAFMAQAAAATVSQIRDRSAATGADRQAVAGLGSRQGY